MKYDEGAPKRRHRPAARFGGFLWRKREQVRRAPDYAEVAHYRPLFQFYKPDCYLFEVGGAAKTRRARRSTAYGVVRRRRRRRGC